MSTKSCATCNGHRFICCKCKWPWPTTNLGGAARRTCTCGARRGTSQRQGYRILCPTHQQTATTCDLCLAATTDDLRAARDRGWRHIQSDVLLARSTPRAYVDLCPRCVKSIPVALDLLMERPTELTDRVKVTALVKAANDVVLHFVRHFAYYSRSSPTSPLGANIKPLIEALIDLGVFEETHEALVLANHAVESTDNPIVEAMREGVRALAEMRSGRVSTQDPYVGGPPAPALGSPSEADDREWFDGVPHAQAADSKTRNRKSIRFFRRNLLITSRASARNAR